MDYKRLIIEMVNRIYDINVLKKYILLLKFGQNKKE